MDPHDKILPPGLMAGSPAALARAGGPDPTAPGAVLAGKYRVERVLGQGGMGVVVEARHMVLEDRVALKFLLPDFAQHPDASARFLREARAAVKIKSEHVARVSDVGTLETGAPYMVMEYLDGSDLAGVLTQSGPLSIADAVDYVIQGCEAIAEAHGYGIVHRDLKPANLFLSKRPNGLPIVKVLDFGISKVVESAVDNLTGTTTSMGSALYMSPEQMQQTRGVDSRTDIYALGISLYELLAGRQPFHAETLPALCAEIFTGTPTPIRALRADVPEGLAAAMEKAYARDRGLRHQTVADFVKALAPFAPPRSQATIESVVRMGGLDAPAAEPRRRSRSKGATPVVQPLPAPLQGGTELMKTVPRPATRAPAPAPIDARVSDGAVTMGEVARPPAARGPAPPAAEPKEPAIAPSTVVAAQVAPPRRGEAALVGGLVGAIAVLGVVAIVAVRSTAPSSRSNAASAPAVDLAPAATSTAAPPAVAAPLPAPEPALPVGATLPPAPEPASPAVAAPAPAPPPVAAAPSVAARAPEATVHAQTAAPPAPTAATARAAPPVAPPPPKPAAEEPAKPRAAAPGKPSTAGRPDVGF
jgi:serine/threonine-protein kinase